MLAGSSETRPATELSRWLMDVVSRHPHDVRPDLGETAYFEKRDLDEGSTAPDPALRLWGPSHAVLSEPQFPPAAEVPHAQLSPIP